MKKNDTQELRPVYLHEANYSADDGISLIDLAMVLVRRRKMIAVITTFIILSGMAAALLASKSYTFTTSIEIGSQIINGTVKSFESPQTLLAKLQYSFIPQTLNEHQLSNPADEKKYKIIVRVPKNSDIIVLEAKGAEEQADLLSGLLQNITQKAAHDHSRIFESVKRNLLSQLEQTRTKLANLGSSANNHAEEAILQSSIEGYSSQLANLRNTREISPPMKSLGPSGVNGKLIVIIAAFAGIFLGVFSAIFAEFVEKVREASRQNED